VLHVPGYGFPMFVGGLAMAWHARIVLFTWVRTLGAIRLESPPLQLSTSTGPPPWDRDQLACPRLGSGSMARCWLCWGCGHPGRGVRKATVGVVGSPLVKRSQGRGRRRVMKWTGERSGCTKCTAPSSPPTSAPSWCPIPTGGQEGRRNRRQRAKSSQAARPRVPVSSSRSAVLGACRIPATSRWLI
jgi:hypothetical protein